MSRGDKAGKLALGPSDLVAAVDGDGTVAVEVDEEGAARGPTKHQSGMFSGENKGLGVCVCVRERNTK